IALPSGAPSELIINAPALVPVGANDIEPAQAHDPLPLFFPGASQSDVRAAARHIRRNGHRPDGPRFGNYSGLGLIVFCIEYLTLHASLSQPVRQQLRFLHAARADQNRAPLFMRPANLPDERLML